jgi:hypothetical protein
MILNNPIVIENQTYDKLIVNLAVSTNYNASGEEDMNIAIRLVPTRLDPERGVVTADANSIGIFRGRLSELQSDAEISLAQNILSSLQNLINSKI